MDVRIFVILLTAFAAFCVFKKRGAKQVFPLLLILFFIPPGIFLVASYPPARVISLLFLVVLAFNKQLAPLFKSFPLKNSFTFFCICMLIVGQADTSINPMSNLYISFIYIADNILPLFIFYAAFSMGNDQMVFFKYLLQLFIFICIYGIFSYLTVTNPYMELYEKGYNIRNISEDYLHNITTGRTQTSSIFFHPYLFSWLLYYIIFITIYFIKFNFVKIPKFLLYLIIVLCIANLILTDSRTAIFITILSLPIYAFIAFPKEKFVRYLLFIPFFIIGLSQIPQVSSSIEKTYVLFTAKKDKKTEGSSIEMREKQLDISLKYFAQSPIIGNGFFYINNKLGYTVNIKDRTSEKAAAGFESYIYVLLIEQGCVGLLANIVVFASLFIYHRRNFIANKNGKYRQFILVNLIFIVGYIIYIIGTGTISSSGLFFGLIGISLSLQKTLKMFNSAGISI